MSHVWRHIRGHCRLGWTVSAQCRTKLRNAVEQRVSAGEIDRESLVLFAHSAAMFGLGKDQAGQVAESLKSKRHRITGIEDRSQMVDVVMHLAVAAAVCRSEALADAVRIVVRRHRGSQGAIPEYVRINTGLF